MILFEYFNVFLINGGSLQDSSDGVTVTLGIAAAATGLSLLAFSEVNPMSYHSQFILFSQKQIIHSVVTLLT